MTSRSLCAVLLAFAVGIAPAAGAQDRTVTLAVPGRINANPSIAARGNFVAVAWSGTLQSTQDVFVATSRDGGSNWSTPVQVNATAGDSRVSGEQPPRVALVPGKGAMPEIVVVWGSKGEKGTRLQSAR